MPSYFAEPPNELARDFIRCSACGMQCKVGRTRKGRFVAATTIDETDSVTTKDFYDLGAKDAANGCPSCGCPDWDTGGKLGDMAL